MIKKPALVSMPSARVEILISKPIMAKHKKPAQNVSNSNLCTHIHIIVIGNVSSSLITAIADRAEFIHA